ncbi:hypothetical protein DIE19_28635, partial [Burkholderia sp. Bp9126]
VGAALVLFQKDMNTILVEQPAFFLALHLQMVLSFPRLFDQTQSCILRKIQIQIPTLIYKRRGHSERQRVFVDLKLSRGRIYLKPAPRVHRKAGTVRFQTADIFHLAVCRPLTFQLHR